MENKNEFRMVNKDKIVHIPLTANEIAHNNRMLADDAYWESLTHQKLEDVEEDTNHVE